MKKEGDLLLHIEVEGDTIEIKIEGNTGDILAALLYACQNDQHLANVVRAATEMMNDKEYIQKSTEFLKSQGDA